MAICYSNAWEAKVKAGKRLMETIVPDIERYVADYDGAGRGSSTASSSLGPESL